MGEEFLRSKTAQHRSLRLLHGERFLQPDLLGARGFEQLELFRAESTADARGLPPVGQPAIVVTGPQGSIRLVWHALNMLVDDDSQRRIESRADWNQAKSFGLIAMIHSIDPLDRSVNFFIPDIH